MNRLAKIDLVTFFDCDYWWLCTIDHVIVNLVGIHHLFNHSQQFKSDLSSIVHNRWFYTQWWAWLSVRFFAFHTRGHGFKSRWRNMFPALICNNIKEKTTKLVPNLSYSNNLVKIRVVLVVAESKSSIYYVPSLFLKDVLVILCWNPWQLYQVSETRHVFGRN